MSISERGDILRLVTHRPPVPASALHLPHDIAQPSEAQVDEQESPLSARRKPARLKKTEDLSLSTELCGAESGPLCTRGGLCPGTKQKTSRRASRGRKGCARRIGGKSEHLRSRRAGNRAFRLYILPCFLLKVVVADCLPNQLDSSLSESAAQGEPRTAFNCQGCGKRKSICQFECSLGYKTTSLTTSHQTSLNLSNSSTSISATTYG